MSWERFRNAVLKKMKSPPRTSDELAETIANEYHKAIRTPPAGDILNRNFIIKANVEDLSDHIKSVYNRQAKTPIPLPIINLISAGFPKYWRSAELSILFPPEPTPAFLPTNVLANRVTFPGLPATKIYPTGKAQTPEQIVNNLVDAAKTHLLTVSGNIQFNCLFPSVPSPVPGTLVLPWFGYNVKDKSEDNDESSEDVFLLITIGFLASSYQGNIEKGRIIAYLIFKRDNKLATMQLEAPSLASENVAAEAAVSIITEKTIKKQVPDNVIFEWYKRGKEIKLINYFKTNTSEQLTFG